MGAEEVGAHPDTPNVHLFSIDKKFIVLVPWHSESRMNDEFSLCQLWDRGTDSPGKEISFSRWMGAIKITGMLMRSGCNRGVPEKGEQK
jgi:hypothetical protein